MGRREARAQKARIPKKLWEEDKDVREKEAGAILGGRVLVAEDDNIAPERIVRDDGGFPVLHVLRAHEWELGHLLALQELEIGELQELLDVTRAVLAGVDGGARPGRVV